MVYGLQSCVPLYMLMGGEHLPLLRLHVCVVVKNSTYAASESAAIALDTKSDPQVLPRFLENGDS